MKLVHTEKKYSPFYQRKALCNHILSHYLKGKVFNKVQFKYFHCKCAISKVYKGENYFHLYHRTTV